MFFYDSGYMLVMLIGMVLVFIPQMFVKNTYAKYSQVKNSRGITGAEVAQAILAHNGVHNVQVEPVHGFLTDHYDPTTRKIRLSEEIYHGRSIAGVAVAAHEAGHALQHATGYYPVVLRSAMVPAVNFGSNLGPILLFVAIAIGATSEFMPEWALTLGWIGVLLFGAAVLFHVVTLPVEINASTRAVGILSNGGYLTVDEMSGAKKVLTAAALTYVATALYALIQLLYFVMRLMSSSRR